MSLSFLLDINISAEWVPILNAAGHTAIVVEILNCILREFNIHATIND